MPDTNEDLESLCQRLSLETRDLRDQLRAKDEEIASLRHRLSRLEAGDRGGLRLAAPVTAPDTLPPLEKRGQLDREDVERYSRQVILPEFRVKSQLRLRNSSVLIVGAGGLGCPAAVYLAAAGVGRIGVVDYDTVDKSNLHRQVLHTEDRVGVSKSVSMAASLAQVNSTVEVIPFHLALNSSNALPIVRQFSVVLDCTDNVATRYLLNDACVLANKPLVSGSALRWEGQLTVYNQPPGDGPTYRCLYPTPPPPGAVTNCSDGGVVGVVPGVIGCLQAMETIKILCDMPVSYSGKLLLFDGMEGRSRIVNLRTRQTGAGDIDKLIDYEEFCGAAATDKDTGVRILGPEDRISVTELSRVIESKEPHVLIDVRTGPEMEMVSLPGSVNIPMDVIQSPIHREKIQSVVRRSDPPHDPGSEGKIQSDDPPHPVYVVCRRGNDSQSAVLLLREIMPDLDIKDVAGGLHGWGRHVDNTFPVY